MSSNRSIITLTLCAFCLVARGADPDEVRMAERMNKISAAVHKIYLIENTKERKVFLDAFNAAIETHQELRAIQTGKASTPGTFDDPFKKLPKLETPSVPAETLAIIKASAAKKWPGDYEMQEFVIKNQTEAWQNLQRIRSGVAGVPFPALQQICTEAVKRWGTDFEMVDYHCRGQIEAYQRMHR